jgi:hypothetical protein
LPLLDAAEHRHDVPLAPAEIERAQVVLAAPARDTQPIREAPQHRTKLVVADGDDAEVDLPSGP